MKKRLATVVLLAAAAGFSVFALTCRMRAGSAKLQDSKDSALLFATYCAPCHGSLGKGDGELAYVVYPKPRNFTRGLFKLRSTPSGSPPTDEDLVKTIRNGMPGTAMPAFSFLKDEQIRLLVSHVKQLSQDCPEGQPCRNFFEGKETKSIHIPKPPPYSQDLISKGAEAYGKMGCFQCHGAQGKGDGPSAVGLKDSWGYPIRVRDFTIGTYVGGGRPEDLYLRFMAGMDGTPMPSFESVIQFMAPSDSERQELLWGLIYYVKSLETKEPKAAPEPPSDGILIARRMDRVVTQQQLLDPHSGMWESIAGSSVPVSRLWQTAGEAASTVIVKAAYTNEYAAVRLEWDDASFDTGSFRVQEFQDAAAVQFSLTEAAGFHGMGGSEQPSNLWFWRAEWQLRKDRGIRPQIQYAYGNRASDADIKEYPAEIQEESRLAGRDAFNPVSLQRLTSPVEDLNAKGPGTLTSQTPEEQNVKGRGHFDGKRWRVVFLRMLESPDKGDVQLKPGDDYPVAFAVWDGSERDRNGQKMVSTWYSLRLEK